MRKYAILLLVCSLVLTACLESETKTTINADGSGSMTATVDFSEMMKMMAGNQKQGEDFVLDTTINIKNYSDTSSRISAYHKSLVRDMKLKVLMDARDISQLKFRVTLISPFKNLEDFNALNELMKRNEFDQIFDNAMSIPELSGKDKNEENNSSNENDNIFSSVFPAFYNCVYSKNSIVCKTDTAKHRQTVEGLTKMDMDINGEMEAKMLESAEFTNTLVLPRSVKKITGDSWKKTTEKELVQTGNYLDLYKNPGKYEYSIQY